MISARSIKKTAAAEKVDILFYLMIQKGGKNMLKPLGFDTKISLMMVRAILDDTIIPSFYDTLSRNLQERGVAVGSKVQLRAKFSEAHSIIDPQLKGTIILCEVDVK